MRNWVNLIFLGAGIFVLSLASAFLPVQAQAVPGPRVLITWQALDSTSPSSYQGKVLPGAGSTISASVAVISGGKLADLSGQVIYWYLDGNLIASGVGKQNITFTAPGFVEIALLRAQVPNFPTGALINTARVQIANPELVIVSPYADNVFSGSSVALQAIPYFFKISELGNLSFQWNVNGQPVTTQENPQNLTINLSASTPSGYSLAVTASAQQSNDPLTNAHANITLNEASQ